MYGDKKVPRDQALPRIKYFKHVKKPEIGWTTFDPAELAKICSDPTVLEVRFLFSTKNAGGKDDWANVILQVKRSGQTIAGDVTYDYYDGTDSGVCPPPAGSCDASIEMP